MRIHIRSAKIIDPNSPYNQSIQDIFIENGLIKDIGQDLTIPDPDHVIQQESMFVSPGWFDLYAHFCDPGYEYKEDLESGINASMAGGFTGVLIRPDTKPALHSKSEIEYIINKTRDSIVDVFPTGALTYNTEGKDLTEIYDLYRSGAKAISNAEDSLDSSGILLRGLQYILPVDGVLLYRPLLRSLAHGLVNEGKMSVEMGMKGSPALSEELAVHEALNIAEYTGAHLHLLKISTAKSVDLIRGFKQNGGKVSASVSAYHLLLDETVLSGFDENYKVNPPLRTQDDISALIEGLNDDTIDAICSDHDPQDTESKNREFEYAEEGIINLEAAFGVLNTALDKKLSIGKIIEKISLNPRKLIGMEVPVIQEGNSANLTLFDPDTGSVFSKSDIKSKSSNTPFEGRLFKGFPIGIVNNNLLHLN